MQLTLKSKPLSIGIFSVIVLGIILALKSETLFLDTPIEINRFKMSDINKSDTYSKVSLFNTKLQMDRGLNHKMYGGLAGKAMNPFKVETFFMWTDKERGEGKVRVEIKSRTFIENQWNYQWILPEQAITRDNLFSYFDSPQFHQSYYFEINVEGLDSSFNQNLFLKLKPKLRNDSAMTIVIPTQSNRTQEGVFKKSFAQNEKIKSLRKNLSAVESDVQIKLPRIQF